MLCDRVRYDLDAYCAGGLSPAHRWWMHHHLVRCSACAEEWRFAQALCCASSSRVGEDATMRFRRLRYSAACGTRRSIWYEVGKRLFDVVASTCILLTIALIAATVFLPFTLALIVVLLKRGSSEPLIVRSPRIGKGGRIFWLWRFRTTESATPIRRYHSSLLDDTPTTLVGQLLRYTKLQQIPEFINVLLGDMSLVGPKHYEPAVAREIDSALLEIICAVRPGLTGPSQINHRYDRFLLNQYQTQEERVSFYLDRILRVKAELDAEYVRRRNLWSDLAFLRQTFTITMDNFVVRNAAVLREALQRVEDSKDLACVFDVSPTDSSEAILAVCRANVPAWQRDEKTHAYPCP
jgi:lipopolysaccharide/colanic/teichoic acid biosynthesis glycosyltransferase